MRSVISNLYYKIYISPLDRIMLIMILMPFCVFFLAVFFYLLARRLHRQVLFRGFCYICMIIALAYAVLAFHMTVVNRERGDRGIILIPLYSFYEARKLSEIYRSMLMNVFLFEPIGLTVPYAITYLLSVQKGDKCQINKISEIEFVNRFKKIIICSILFCFCFSLLIEICQGIFRRGRVEIDDVIMNMLGTMIGTFCYWGFCHFTKTATNS